MRRITVMAYEKALVFKNGKLVEVLSQGNHWIGWNKTVQKFDITELFYHEIELDLLMQNKQFASLVDVKTVSDNELLIQYKNGNFYALRTAGTYCFWRNSINYSFDLINLDSFEVSQDINRKVLKVPAVSNHVNMHLVESYEKGLLYVDGKFEKIINSGVYYFWKGEKLVTTRKVDLRTQQVEISGQELLTKDKAAIRISLFASYNVTDIMKAIDDTKDYARQLYILFQLALREYVGQYTLDELLANKQSASDYILKFTSKYAVDFGVKIINCGIKDLILPGDMKDIMNQVLIAEKKAQANVIMRREETASTRSLLNTARFMEDNEMLFRLKEMEYIEKISEKIGEITVNGGGRVVDQLRELLGST